MVMYEVHRHPVLQKYRTHICSKATIFQFFVIWLTYLPPLIIAFVTYGFWMKESSFREQPNVQFKHQLLLVAQGNTPGSYLAYSTFLNFNQLLQQNLRIPLVKSWEEDTNYDGKYDSLNFDIRLPLKDAESIYSVQVIMLFDYKLHKYVSLQMEGMAYIHYDSPIAGAEFRTVGELKLRQTSLLPNKGKHSTYNTSIIDSSKTSVETYDLFTIFSSYIKRNVSTEYVSKYPVWTGGRASGQPFVIKGTIHYPEEMIFYRPGFWQMLKWAWVQYLSVLFIFLFVFDRVKRFIFEEQIVSTVPMQLEKEHQD
ncbi:transmembrane protein 231 [Exaiptasia diaphana]|uniref:Transmembrane protein 231 n=1 Tax=Exaiptasia diaphana TaxID=2652724 RepID=A0A913WUP0_EXADI|nr:transmembrane protein 231 [Exaiptasia diaphana]KXJ17698.1 Transmembrane protein 231 [Exaiptasia diaphana]